VGISTLNGPDEASVTDAETRVDVRNDVARAVHMNGTGGHIGKSRYESLRPVTEYDVPLVVDHCTQSARNAQREKPLVIFFVLLVEDRECNGQQTASRVHELPNGELSVVAKLNETGI
jgi:hypothetical protein